MPSYHESSPFEYKLLSDIAMDVRVGDRIYFHFNTIKMGNIVHEEGIHPKKTWWLRVRYDQVICIVRTTQSKLALPNGDLPPAKTDIIPVGGYALIDPDMETWEDTKKKTYSSITDKEGKPMLNPPEKWLTTKLVPEHKYLTGFVRQVGKPLDGDQVEITGGQKIWYRKNADWQVKIEDQDYFVVRQRHIIGKEVGGEFSPTRNYMLVSPIQPSDKTPVTGLHVNRGHPKRGLVVNPGRTAFKVGQLVDFGLCPRTDLVLKNEKVLHIHGSDVFACQPL